MRPELTPGALSAPLSGVHWDVLSVRERLQRHRGFYARLGLRPGDRVLLHHGNTPEFFVDLAAIWSLGGCVVPIDARLTVFEIETLARAAAPRFCVSIGDLDGALHSALAGLGGTLVDSREANAAAAGDPPTVAEALDQDALILFTSGTTGEPKGVVHTHRSLQARWAALHRHLGTHTFRRTLCLLPTHFGHGLICNSLYPWLMGQHLFIAPPFKPELILQLGRLLDEHRITFMSSVPPVWRLALKAAAPPRAASLERVFCGSAPLSAHMWNDVRRWTGTPHVWNAYGITETGSWLAGTSMPDVVPEDGLVGEPWGGVVRVLPSRETGAPGCGDVCRPGENGHVWVNTPALMRGYLGRDDLTASVVSAGWFATGDIGCVDERGWLYLRGREREEINKGGMKVYPGDIDAVVERFEATVDVCTFAVEDALLGEDIGLALVLHRTDAATLQRLHEWMSRHLARHQMPRRWYVVEDIPRTSRGKVNRAAVAARCASCPPVDLRGVLQAGD